MTEKAKEIGALNTNFVNTTGLHVEDHYTTVRDLATILAYALKNPTFRTIFTSESHVIQPTNKHSYGMTLQSTMFKALDRAELTNEYIIGGKTGFTEEARQCLASLARKNGREYILVTVGAGFSNASWATYHVKDAVNIYNSYI